MAEKNKLLEKIEECKKVINALEFQLEQEEKYLRELEKAWLEGK